MNRHAYKSTGISLLTGAFLIIVTMVLHPSGGSLERIVAISKTIMIAHALAILSLPFLLFGCYGLTKVLMDRWKLSILALITTSFALIAALFAALFNGLVLPYFLNQYADQLEAKADILRPISNFSFAINVPLDYVFIVGICLAILLYSVLILIERKFPAWIGYLGVVLILLAIAGGVTGFVFTSLLGFRIFVFGIATWILGSGVYLFRHRE
ncbi:MAG: hypothetical protein AAF466_11335 [Bacteroidota bacterium]